MTAQSPAIDELLRHAGWVRSLALQLCADVHAAEDVAQETWAAVLRSPPAHASNPRGWLARVLRNALAMGRRGDTRRARREAEAAIAAGGATPGADDPAELVERAELHRILVARVLALGEPQREAVLRHYFEGQPVGEVARKMRTSADAVRALLRRARENLRTGLEGDARGRRPFALLVAATKPGGAVATAGTAALAAAGVITMQSKLLFGAAVLLVAALVVAPLVVSGSAAAGPDDPASHSATNDAAQARDTAASQSSDPGASVRTEVAAPSLPAPLLLHLRLDGLLPDAPWTAPVKILVAGSRYRDHEASAAPDARGEVALALPEWARTARWSSLRVSADDPAYLPVAVGLAPEAREALEAGEPLAIGVEATCKIEGRVLDPTGKGLASALVHVFAVVDGKAVDPSRASTETRVGGTFRLRVPVSGPLLVLALPPGSDAGPARDDLAPACRRVEARMGAVARVEPMSLAPVAFVSGVVLDENGVPCAGKDLVWVHDRADAQLYVDLPGAFNLAVWNDGRAGRTARAKTDAAGRFRLPAVAGAHGFCRVVGAFGSAEPLVAPAFATAPADVEIRMAAGVVVRVTHDGAPVEGAAVRPFVTANDRVVPPRFTNHRGETRIPRGAPGAFSVDVEAPGLASTSVEFPASASSRDPFVVELPGEPMARLRLEREPELMNGTPMLRLTLERLDRRAGKLELNVNCPGWADSPCHVDVPVGRYLVNASHFSPFVAAISREVDVPPAGATVRLRMVEVGHLRVLATDATGRYLDRHRPIELIGEDKTRHTLGGDGPREILNLAPGHYELVVANQRRTVTVKAGAVTDVRVVL